MEVLILKDIGELKVWFRDISNNQKIKNSQPMELEKMINLLTNEEFQDSNGKYLRQLKNPENFEIVEKYQGDYTNDGSDYTCICTEDTCSHLIIIKHIPSNICFAVGTVCYKRFDESNSCEIYHKLTAKKCTECVKPLVFKECTYQKNTSKKCNDRCFDCLDKFKNELLIKEKELNQKLHDFHQKEHQYNQQFQRVYLNVDFDMKDIAKSLGAKWDLDKKIWYAPNQSFKNLINEFS